MNINTPTNNTSFNNTTGFGHTTGFGNTTGLGNATMRLNQCHTMVQQVNALSHDLTQMSYHANTLSAIRATLGNVAQLVTTIAFEQINENNDAA